ncbi:2,3-dimethylmalate dehydratase small subunit [Koleobacter methoxysyntrophicus]|jgi:3-isopropylmalate/(R)-2-methylmalate dehydratase small subunit|uniref:3-isopropylmalate dehydratase small subunit n=1 Tax=Koleobacter methoxysyntrophicus TaxID=2751313 RepID=A0A8A0RPY1_9FIRM|nr:3-isopropylmalate dehydratase small subunit [Koleobacter methoxysyntrophicus]QSQ10303.1 2,3-dimethylmalate dehydratase small subunit [Koleobacter methoxysyntrophicus]
MLYKGKAIKYGDNIDTDVIIPARYLNIQQPEELAKHCMEDLDKDFLSKIEKGDILVAGRNFGCGSSREHAPIAIKASGISCIIAVSFSRIFYRNSINIGLPILECPEAVIDIENGDILEINGQEGVIINTSKNRTYKAQAFPPFIMDIISKGGLMAYAVERVGSNGEI